MSDGIRADWAQKDFYAELGVKKDATEAEIKKAYRKLARENHPDSNPGAADKHEKFKKVAEAYDVVGDPEKRKRYDEARSMFAGGFPGFGRGGGGQGAGGGGFDVGDLFGQGGQSGGFGDLFGDIFRGGRQQQRPRQPRQVAGDDLESSASISFDDAMKGTTIGIRLSGDAACPTCAGTGGKPGTKPHICEVCQGAGFVVNDLGGAFSVNETCPNCGGRQLVYSEPCPTCHGSGRSQTTRTIQARIPAGVKDGQRIRLRGKGGAGSNGGPAGDLYITVRVAPHRIFGRKGDNLTIDVPVSFDEAALGADIKLPTLGGQTVTLKIPAGTPNGRTFRVRGKGPRRSDGSTGDLLATVEVQVPTTLNDSAREAVEAYRAAVGGHALREKLLGGA